MGQCLQRTPRAAVSAPAPAVPSPAVSSVASDPVSNSPSPTPSSAPSDFTASSWTSTPEATLRVAAEPCQLPVAACLVELDPAWAARLERLGLSMSESQRAGWLEWLETNHEVTAGWTGSNDLEATWECLSPASDAPLLEEQQLCVYYRWNLSRSWHAMEAVVLTGGPELCRGGTASTTSMHLCGTRVIVSDRAERLADRVFELRHEDRIVRLSGVPLAEGPELERRLKDLRRVHRAGGPTLAAGAVELLQAAAEDDAAVLSTGVADFVGLGTRRHTVVAAGARVSVAVTTAGILAQPRTALHRICPATDPAAFVLHAGGHQHLLLTVLRQGRLEMQLELPSGTHFR
jgi:hypothetical protein